MEEKDILLRQLEQIMRALSELIARRRDGGSDACIDVLDEMTNEVAERLNVDLSALIEMDNGEGLVNKLINELSFENIDIENLARLLFELS